MAGAPDRALVRRHSCVAPRCLDKSRALVEETCRKNAKLRNTLALSTQVTAGRRARLAVATSARGGRRTSTTLLGGRARDDERFGAPTVADRGAAALRGEQALGAFAQDDQVDTRWRADRRGDGAYSDTPSPGGRRRSDRKSSRSREVRLRLRCRSAGARRAAQSRRAGSHRPAARSRRRLGEQALPLSR